MSAGLVSPVSCSSGVAVVRRVGWRLAWTRPGPSLLSLLRPKRVELAQVLQVTRSGRELLHRYEVLVAADPERRSVRQLDIQRSRVERCVVEAWDPAQSVKKPVGGAEADLPSTSETKSSR